MSDARTLSGLYECTTTIGPFWRCHLELRLDVDGPDALNVASGTLRFWNKFTVEWIAHIAESSHMLANDGTKVWKGTIHYRHGFTELSPLALGTVRITVPPAAADGERHATLELGGPSPSAQTFDMVKVSDHFRSVDVQVDYDRPDQLVTLDIDPYIIAGNHPPESALGLPHTFTLADAYDLAGVEMNVRKSSTNLDPNIQDSLTENNELGDVWTPSELHAAMLEVWKPHGHNYVDVPSWALWVFFVQEIRYGSFFGFMFDCSDFLENPGPERQGVVIQQNIWTLQQPNYPSSNSADWVRRHKFFTTVHEIGHTFNLYHPRSKLEDSPWPFVNPDPLPTSFMSDFLTAEGNIKDQDQGFFQDFMYRFREDELLFLRHAPEEFIQMGRAASGEDHGHTFPTLSTDGTCRLELETGREEPVYEFLEPVYLDLILTNESEEPVFIDPAALEGGLALKILVRREGGPTRRWRPRYRPLGLPLRLEPGKIACGSILVSQDIGGWLIAEPGNYVVQAVLDLGDAGTATARRTLRVLQPQGKQEDRFACDFFQPDVGLLLSLEGSRAPYLDGANAVLERLVRDRKLSRTMAARHARYALNRSRAIPFKQVVGLGGASWKEALATRKVVRDSVESGSAGQELEVILSDPGTRALFGQVEFARRAAWYTNWLDRIAKRDKRAKDGGDRVLSGLRSALPGGRGAKILEAVLTRDQPLARAGRAHGGD